jgi:hypothetical protein
MPVDLMLPLALKLKEIKPTLMLMLTLMLVLQILT